MDLPEFNKVTIWDPETEKEYICDNEFDFKIRQFMELKQCVDFDDEVVELAFSLRDELINDLDNNNSVSDSIKCKYIKYIEKNYLMYILDFHIQQNILVDSTSKLNEFQPFQYKPKSQKSEVTKKHKGKGGRPPDPGRAKTIRQLQTDYYNYTEKKGWKKFKAIQELIKKYPQWKKSTIERYIKITP